MDKLYYLSVHGSPIGPMTAEQMMSYDVTPQSSVSTDGMSWAPLFHYPELMTVYHDHAHSAISTPEDAEITNKRILCGVLAIVLGTLGVQYFVINKVGGGFLCILLSIVTCGLWSVITLIQGIMILTMTNRDFEHKYLDSQSAMPLF